MIWSVRTPAGGEAAFADEFKCRRDGTLSGVIDFGDMCAGDPTVDIAAAWVLLPAGAAARFFDAYAHADEATIRRARGGAALKSLALMLIGQAGERGLPGGKPTWDPRAGRRSTVFWHRSERRKRDPRHPRPAARPGEGLKSLRP